MELITWPPAIVFYFWEVEMVIGWICSRDLFETSWGRLHEVLPIVIAGEQNGYVCYIASVALLS